MIAPPWELDSVFKSGPDWGDTTVRWARAKDVPPDWPMPRHATDGSAGVDLPAYLPHGFTWLPPGARIFVRTGWHVVIPRFFEGSVRPRSGLAVKHGVTVFNSPGTVDHDFRGEMCVCLYNGNHHRPKQHSPADGSVCIHHGDRIAQLVIAPVARAVGEVIALADLPTTARGEGGWGSTGRLCGPSSLLRRHVPRRSSDALIARPARPRAIPPCGTRFLVATGPT